MKTPDGYSAKVSLILLVNGVSLALSHVEPGAVRVRDTCVPIVGACNAELLITVNGRTDSKAVFLPAGVPAAREMVRYF